MQVKAVNMPLQQFLRRERRIHDSYDQRCGKAGQGFRGHGFVGLER
ncbi:MAG TPA: hypothetical protein GX506_10545 [Firmicutes bacterium]|nr:hypothetical protein [Bacillota bacterium]